MKAKDRFRLYVSTQGPVKAIKICPRCGRPTMHCLVWCKKCGKKTEWIKFDTWVDLGIYILIRHNKKDDETPWSKWGADPHMWALDTFSKLIEEEKGLEGAKLYLDKLTYWTSLYIMFEECNIKYPYKKSS